LEYLLAPTLPHTPPPPSPHLHADRFAVRVPTPHPPHTPSPAARRHLRVPLGAVRAAGAVDGDQGPHGRGGSAARCAVPGPGHRRRCVLRGAAAGAGTPSTRAHAQGTQHTHNARSTRAMHAAHAQCTQHTHTARSTRTSLPQLTPSTSRARSTRTRHTKSTCAHAARAPTRRAPAVAWAFRTGGECLRRAHRAVACAPQLPGARRAFLAWNVHVQVGHSAVGDPPAAFSPARPLPAAAGAHPHRPRVLRGGPVRGGAVPAVA
jgi:hypothetical protein